MKVMDIHVHGIGGYDTRTVDEEHLRRIARIEAAEGVEAFMPTIYPSTIKVMRGQMTVVKGVMERQAAGKEGQEPEARILGVHLEGPFLNPEKCGALNAVTFIEPTDYRLEELIEGFEGIIKIITIAPELEGAPKLIRALADRGIAVSMGHSNATYAQAEAGFNSGARGVTHLFNAMRGFHHREPGLAGFGLMNPEVYVEVIADPYHLHPATLELVLRLKSADRVILVSDTVQEAKTSSQRQAVADGHGTLLGGSMSVTEAALRLVDLGYERNAVTKYITENPARYLSYG